MSVQPLLALVACMDYGLQEDPGDPPAAGLPPVPAIEVDPASYDFGATDPWSTSTEVVTVRNVGTGPLTVTDLGYEATSAELAFSALADTNGPLPWTLRPGESRQVAVTFTPVDDTEERGTLVVASDDPDRPEVEATQVGSGLFEGFETGWYVVNDDTPQDLTTDPNHVVDFNGDSDAYWYEPSGVHGMTGSTDVATDFAWLHDYVVARAGAPTTVTGPLSFYAASTLQQMQQGSFSYILCDFWMDPGEDPSRYTISSGQVDDGIRVIVNGEIVGELTYLQSGSWPLTNAVPGKVNTMVVILEDNARIEKFVYDLAFYKDGVIVAG